MLTNLTNNMEIKVAIIEDEIQYQEDLKNELQKFFNANELFPVFYIFSSAIEFFDSNFYIFDCIFLDVNMPGCDGISAAKQIRSKLIEVPIIFVTSLAQYAIKGYEVQALDYLLKPVTYAALNLRLKKLVTILKKSVDSTYFFKNKTIEKRIPINDILYIEVNKHTLFFHLKNEILKTTGSLSKVMDALPNNQFALCNQCYFVNLRQVKSVSGYELDLGSEIISISHPRKKEFMHSLNKYLHG